jgi:hypothetical protein
MSKITAWGFALIAIYISIQVASATNHPEQQYVHITPPLAPITTPAVITPYPKYMPPPMNYGPTTVPTTSDTVIHDIVI